VEFLQEIGIEVHVFEVVEPDTSKVLI